MAALQCHSRGNKDYSAFYAYVTIGGKRASIEDWWQLSKRCHGFPAPTHWKQIKGKPFDYFNCMGFEFPLEDGNAFYDTLWLFYFAQNPHLLRNAMRYDEFEDIFRSKNSRVCQADTIRDICKLGWGTVFAKHHVFIYKLLTGIGGTGNGTTE